MDNQSNIQMSVPSRFLCRRDLVRSVWNILGSCRDTNCVSTWILYLRGKICVFLSGGPKAVWPSNCLKIHPVADVLLLTELSFLHPLVILKQAGRSQHLVMGTLAGNVTSMQWPHNGAQHSQTHSRGLLPLGQYRYDQEMCLQVLESAGSHTNLTLEFRPLEQAWKFHIF